MAKNHAIVLSVVERDPSVAEAAHCYIISRCRVEIPLARDRGGEVDTLQARSRPPRRHPNATSAVIQTFVELT